MTQSTSKKKHAVPKDWQEKFLNSLRESPVVAYACKEANVSRGFAYDQRKTDAEFRAKWDDALAEGLDVLEDTARKRGIESSDTLLIFLLKAHNPEKYRDRLELNLTRDQLRDLSDEELERLAGGGK